MKLFFVMLNTLTTPVPLIHADGVIVFFDTGEAAAAFSELSFFGANYGFTVYGPDDGIKY